VANKSEALFRYSDTMHECNTTLLTISLSVSGVARISREEGHETLRK